MFIYVACEFPKFLSVIDTWFHSIMVGELLYMVLKIYWGLFYGLAYGLS